MKKIKIKKLTLLNFKEIRNLTVDFGEDLTSISGRNGSGKTTIFDAFCWVLFGKNSDEKKEFNIKTLDENGVAIPKLPHEVEAVLEVDKKLVTLRRTYTEKWTTKNGTSIEELTGNTTALFYNDVPCGTKEWAEKIKTICSEDVFKLITNPQAFTSLKPMEQREILFHMAGADYISNEEIANDETEFVDLVKVLSDKSLEEYKKEVASKKKRVKAEIETIPSRIDECQGMLDQGTDFAQYEKDKKDLEQKMQEVELALISDKGKVEATQSRINELHYAIKDAKSIRMKTEDDLRLVFCKDFFAERQKATDIFNKIAVISADDNAVLKELNIAKAEIELKKEQKEQLTADWYAKQAETLDNNALSCPVCKRVFDETEIETIKANFNSAKATALADINTKGHKLKDEIAELEKKVTEYEAYLKESKMRKAKLDAELAKLPQEMPDCSEQIANDPSIIELNKAIASLEKELAEVGVPSSNEELMKQKKELEVMITHCEKVLAIREQDKATKKRIADLEKQQAKGNEELARLEGIEYSIQQFTKRKIELIEGRVNGLFQIVKFKMFNQQINGGEEETCEAMVNGVPYKDLNHASKINAGLDIINALSKFEGVNAPVFIDNAEAINEVMQTDSQMICLRVSEDDLKVE